MNENKITSEQYQNALAQKKAAEETINAYHSQKGTDFLNRWFQFQRERKPFTPEELIFSAGARCETCGAGLAYPKDCGPHHHWDCSGWLLGKHNEQHAQYPFAFYSIISELQKERAGGKTTRPSTSDANQPR